MNPLIQQTSDKSSTVALRVLIFEDTNLTNFTAMVRQLAKCLKLFFIDFLKYS